ncbi:MAPEG family protein [Vibrio rotiferianus]|uniref:MAPEG family protein n=1 Tax=Vibrio rotiferianus TaxID=190895 RepID=UPI000576767A|nr:MAPEG family protein [Vibrio rotiferianus]PIB16785.1 hypothetical protein B853_09347 [Vibrio rotiferianus CAIM 577 = LMG 21460]
MELDTAYSPTIVAIGLTGFVFLVQLLVLDVLGLAQRHTPGHPIEADHESFLFRASRSLHNSNESVGIYILFVMFALLSSASADMLNIAVWVYLTGRVLHMLFYYINLKILRSIAFVISLIGLGAIFILGAINWF